MARSFTEGMAAGMAMSIAFMLRSGSETEAHEWWEACGLSLPELEAIGVDEYDLDPIRAAGFGPTERGNADPIPPEPAPYRRYPLPGSVEAGMHGGLGRDDMADPINLQGSGPAPIVPREG